MDVRSLQRPLKEQYRREPSASRITLTARGAETATPMTCSVDIGRAIYQAEAHKGVGGTGKAECSGDLLLGALAACAQDRKSTRLNSSHVSISYAAFRLKQKSRP